MDNQETIFERERYRQEVRSWAAEAARKMRGASPRRTGQLLALLKHRLRMRTGVPEAVFFQFPRYAVWVEKGAGKGHGGRKGSRWYSNGTLRRTDKASLGRMNSGARRARPFINPVLDTDVELLADIMVHHMGSQAINAMRIR